jgi:ligand-binding sensor domain-containing protein
MCTYATILVLLLTVPAYAVDTLQVTTPDPVLERWRWTTFDESSGLAGSLREIYEDRDGNVWFGTDAGVQRYDGLHWVTYTTEDGLANNLVLSILHARDGAMWFGTGGGVSRFESSSPSAPGQSLAGSSEGTRQPNQGVWTTYTTKDGLAADRVFELVQTRDGSIWAGSWINNDDSGTKSGISQFDGEHWNVVEVPVGPPRPAIVDILEARDGSLWFTTRFHGILRLDDTGWSRYSTENDLPNDSLAWMMESRDGTLWFAHGLAGITRFDPALAQSGQDAWKTYTTEDGLPPTGQYGFISVW